MSEINEETLHVHICDYLREKHKYRVLEAKDLSDTEYYFVEKHLLEFLETTQSDSLNKLRETYGSGTTVEIIKAIHKELTYKPLWLVIRGGVQIKDVKLYLYTPKPRSINSSGDEGAFAANIFAYKKEFYPYANSEAIDLVIYLNGLPIISVELKHLGDEGKGTTYEDAINQYVDRKQDQSKIFALCFAHFAADNLEVTVASNPSKADNFKYYNDGLVNKPDKEGEYPIWHLYGLVFSPEYISNFIEYFLLYVAPDSEKNKPAKTIIPRYHQSRSVRDLAKDLLSKAQESNSLGFKYLIAHSAGSGKTLTIAWMAEQIDSLHKAVSNEKVLDIVFILTDRKSLNKNIKDDLELFVHMKDKVKITEDTHDLRKAIKNRTNIIVTTIQKFNYIQDELQENKELKELKVGFLIDEAHRSQGSKMAKNIKRVFSDVEQDEIDLGEDTITVEDQLEEKFKDLDISNQVYIAFTATPIQKTINLFGIPYDEYTEDEAIQEGYILDVAQSIVSYRTMYNLTTYNAKHDDRLYAKGVVSKALTNIAYEDEDIIQFKCAIIADHFDKHILPMLNGNAKAMIVTSSRQAGYTYFQIVSNALAKKGVAYKALYAFTPFTEKNSKEEVDEAKVNGLAITEENPIENYFEKDEYKLLIVANKFQTGFDEPKLCAMYLDKVVRGVNAIQTVSRLNRWAEGKDDTIVIDFTNNSEEIFKAFSKYRKGVKIVVREPDPNEIVELYDEIRDYNVFSDDMIRQFIEAAKTDNDTAFSTFTLVIRESFQQTIPNKEDQKEFVGLLHSYVKKFNLLAQFNQFDEKYEQFALFCDLISHKLIRIGTDSTLKESLKNVTVSKAAVNFIGNIENPSDDPAPRKPRKAGEAPEPPRATIEEVIADITTRFSIAEGDEIIIKEIYAEQMTDEELKNLVFANMDNNEFLQGVVAAQIKKQIIQACINRGQMKKTLDPLYKDAGGIFDIMVNTVIKNVVRKS